MIGRVRLRTKFLVAMLLTSAGLTAVSLLIVQRTVDHQVRRGLSSDLANSVETFRNLQRQREAELGRSAELMADLPNLKALMTSRHAPTIQDASRELFELSDADLFALLDSTGQLMGFHTRSPGITLAEAQQLVEGHALQGQPLQWWFAGGHLYEVKLEPIYFGPHDNNSLLGIEKLIPLFARNRKRRNGDGEQGDPRERGNSGRGPQLVALLHDEGNQRSDAGAQSHHDGRAQRQSQHVDAKTVEDHRQPPQESKNQRACHHGVRNARQNRGEMRNRGPGKGPRQNQVGKYREDQPNILPRPFLEIGHRP